MMRYLRSRAETFENLLARKKFNLLGTRESVIPVTLMWYLNQ